MFFKSLASGVRSAFSALAVLFMANPEPPDIEYLFPRGRRDSSLSVRYWAQLAFFPGVSRETANNTFVKSATHYKSRRGKEHERLLIELRVPSPGTQDIFTAFIITERGPDPDDKRRSSELSLASSLNQSSPSISQPDDSIHANDIVVVCGTRKHQSPAHIKDRLRENYDALCTVTPTKPMSLAELAILMTVVNNHAISYHLLKYQCYWYTYTVWEVIRTHFGGEVTGNTEENRRGKYMGVPITRGDSVAAITETFETEWKTLCDKERGDTEAARIKEVKFPLSSSFYTDPPSDHRYRLRSEV